MSSAKDDSAVSESDAAGAMSEGEIGTVKKGYIVGHLNPRTGKRRKLYVNPRTGKRDSRDSNSEVDSDEFANAAVDPDNSEDDREWEKEHGYPSGMPVDYAEMKKNRKSKHAKEGESPMQRLQRKLQKAAKKAMIGVAFAKSAQESSKKKKKKKREKTLEEQKEEA